MDFHQSTTIRVVGLGVITILIAGGCDGSTGPEAGARDEIVYHAHTVGAEADLFAVRADGAQPRRLTTAPGDHLFPAVSPDGGASRSGVSGMETPKFTSSTRMERERYA